jgi:hypothetical protein
MDIGCEHRFPEELDGLSPVEEWLIALHPPFGFIIEMELYRSGWRKGRNWLGAVICSAPVCYLLFHVLTHISDLYLSFCPRIAFLSVRLIENPHQSSWNERPMQRGSAGASKMPSHPLQAIGKRSRYWLTLPGLS